MGSVNKEEICIVIRVYDRLEDLYYCLKIIRHTWKVFNYYVVVVSNGINKGFVISNQSRELIDKLIELNSNLGHLKGNSQLLTEAIPHIPNRCSYTVILEADTWIHGDLLVQKYVDKLISTKAVWASAQWHRKLNTLATDFAIINTDLIKNNPEIFNFNNYPEYYVAEYLAEYGLKRMYIKENMPINLPMYVKGFPFAPTGRFSSFPNAKMVTHHIETLKNGIEEKKFFFNVVVNKSYFKVADKRSYKWIRYKMQFAFLLSYLFPYKSWIIKRKVHSIN